MARLCTSSGLSASRSVRIGAQVRAELKKLFAELRG
jgi:hypothetical protein